MATRKRISVESGYTVNETPPIEEEHVRVRAWRVEQLERVGFEQVVAETLCDAGVDLGLARYLHARDCPLDLAERILL